MSVKINTIMVCPRCQEANTGEAESINCGHCGFPLGAQTANVKAYTTPYTLTEQHAKYGDDKKYLEAIMKMDLDKMMSIMNDALNIVEILPTCKNSPNVGISNLIGLAKSIGDIARAYENYLIAGGKHPPDTIANAYKTNNITKEVPKNVPQSKSASFFDPPAT